ncbi:DNA N-6-adenine-methyltransferase [Chishuiella sp.]|uniref:DNA N-6-adenine-methyltransferase n=1 Tax=Chishuiella sp. TaxID=1969467 RepID=UPI0028AD9F16|nr:DNA N-6-adenine-methyltransferase [Chishuiella sp.]
MAIHQTKGKTDEWYTPKYIFDALEVSYFDLDVAHPCQKTFVPALNFYTEDSLNKEWFGFVWMNPPWCKTKSKINWIKKFINHANGLALMPDSTSSEWWQYFAKNSDAVLFTSKRVCFIKPDNTKGDSPANGTTLFAIGEKAVRALKQAEKNKLGIFLKTHL